MSTRELWKSLFLYAFVFCVSIGSACFAVDSPSSLSNSNWLSMEFPSSTSGSITATVCDPSGNLYICGSFKTKDVNPIPFGVAKWDGTKWIPFLSGADDSVAVYSVVYSSGTIYASGYFEPKTGPAFGFAKWNGTNWSQLGKDYGTLGPANLITCDSSGNLYASGSFKTETNVPFCFGKWNGSASTWIPLGTDSSSVDVGAIVCDSSGNLYAGGLLNGSDYSVAKWNGTTWSQLGTLNGSVKTFAFDSLGKLYAGGMLFDGSNNSFGVAKWDGSKWNFIGGKGFFMHVNTLAFDSSGNLYAGGYITNIADGIPANNIARWDGSTWSAIGSGTGSTINSLSYSSAKLLNTGGNFTTKLLYVGGDFTTAGGKSSNKIAKLIFPPPPGAPTAVTAVRGDTKATVSFTPPVPNGEFPLTSFEVTSSPDGIKATGAASPIAVTRLTNGKSYTFTVKATNAIGPFGPASAASSSVIPATVPDAPTNVAATPGIGQASVAFTAPFNGGSAITGYTVTSDPGGILKTGTASPIIVTGLTNGVGYTFTLTATNALGISEPSDASASVIPAIPVTAIGAITGTVKVDSVLTAGAVTPVGATVNYQWMRCASSSAATGDIIGENKNTYTAAADDVGKFIKVQVTGIGGYSGTKLSTATTAVPTPITAPTIGGVATAGQILTATATPPGATVTYQWQRAAISDGSYSNIVGATAKTYTLAAGDVTKYIKVETRGTGSYSGTTLSAATSAVSPIQVTGIAAITGTVKVGSMLTAGAVTPSAATVTYQWTSCATVDGTYTEISGATAKTYTVGATEITKFIKVVATGTGGYGGSATSAATTAVPLVPVTAIGAITGTAKVGSVLTAGAVTPADATVYYTWMRCGTAAAASGVPIGFDSKYTVTAADVGKFIKVQARGTVNYSGTKLSAATAAVFMPSEILSISPISRREVRMGNEFVAGNVLPATATVTYQWLYCSESAEGPYENVPSGGTSNTLFYPHSEKYFKVTVTGTGIYSGSVTSAPVNSMAKSITNIGAISGTVNVGAVLTAGALTPAGATVTYDWQTAPAVAGTWTSTGSTANTYTVAAGDKTKFIRVVATGNGGYINSAISAATIAVPTPITVLPTIGGTAKVGQILTATVTPSLATVTYQWQSASISGGPYSKILGATAKAYTLKATDVDKFIRIVVTGTASYSGTVESSETAAVSPIQVTGIAAITGTVKVGSVLTAGALAPTTATVAYQWMRCDTATDATGLSIGENKNTYTVIAADTAKYIRVVATGTGGYSGSKTSAATTIVLPAPLTAIGTITGTVSIGSKLTAGALTPAASSATATYLWQSSSAATGPWTSIGDSSGTYTIKDPDDVGRLIRVKATAVGYTGEVTSPATKAVPSPLTAPTIGGTAAVGQILTATATPSGATVTYQWQRAAISDGPYSNIVGAMAKTYTLAAADTAKYIKVVTTGTGNYSGTTLSAATSAVSPIPVTGIAAITGTVKVGSVLTAGAVTPSAATVTYQWTSCDTVDGTYTEISGATAKTYTVGASEITKFIKVVATGTGGYGSSATSVATTAVPRVPVTAIGAITGTVKVGSVLTAGAVLPAGATVDYQWMRCDTSSAITGVSIGLNQNTYLLDATDAGKFIKVKATGDGSYISSVTSAATTAVPTPITAPTIGGTATVGQILTATATPPGATVTYQWQRAAISDGPYSNIGGATTQTYTLAAADVTKYIKVGTTGTGNYSGMTLSAATSAVSPIQVTGIAAITGTVKVGSVLTAGALTPSAATVTYQWTSCATVDGTYTEISGATAKTYTVGATEITKFIKVVATGTGGYGSSVTSAATTAVPLVPVTAIGAIVGNAKVGAVLTAGTVTPAGATVSYDWQTAPAASGDWRSTGIIANTYTVAEGVKYIRLVATGTGNYTGSATSASITTNVVRITGIGDIVGAMEVGTVLKAGAVSPAGATVTYDWQTSPNGSLFFTSTGVTTDTYTLATEDAGKIIHVVVTGTGSYVGTAESQMKLVLIPITHMSEITSNTQEIEANSACSLTAGKLTPNIGIMANYQWSCCDTIAGTYSNISGENGFTYNPTAAVASKYIKVTATGDPQAGYSGSVTSAAVGPVKYYTKITAIGAITGTAKVDSVLTAGAVTPAGATVTYDWQTAPAASGSWTSTGITTKTYTVVAGDKTRYIRVVATGKNFFNKTSTATSAEVGPVPAQVDSIGDITGDDFKVGVPLTAGALTPLTATVTYQWSSCGTADGTYANISGATLKTYTPTVAVAAKYLKVTATGSGIYSGSVKSAATRTAITAPVTAIGAITGTAKVGYTLTAGALTPVAATVNYQWKRCDTSAVGDMGVDIGTKSTYELVDADAKKYIRVVATGTDSYFGSATSAATLIAATLPGAPTIGTATPGNARTEVSFTPPSSNGGSVITLYTVTSNPGAKTATGTASPITVTGLTNGTAYTFTVKASNAVGAGSASAASNPATPAAAPAVTTNPSNRSVMEGDPASFRVTVTGTPTPTCLWQVSTDGGVTWADLANDATQSGVTTTTMTVINTTAAISRYQFRCMATNGAGSVPSNAAILRVAPTDLNFSGSDNFTSNPNTNWSAPTMSASLLGQLSFANDSLEYTVSSSSSDNTVVREWTPNVGSYMGVGSYSKDWQVQVDVHLDSLGLANIGEYANLNLIVVNAIDAASLFDFDRGTDHMNVAIDRYYKAGTGTVADFRSELDSYYTGNNTGLLEIEDFAFDATLRISFNCITKELTSSYSIDAGASWIRIKTINIGSGSDYDWGMTDNSTFAVLLAGGSSGVSITAGQAYFDNFLAGTTEVLTVSSTSFQDGKAMPVKYANTRVTGGKDISPELSWSHVPEGTASIAVTCIDTLPAANNFVHWMAINIPIGSTGLAEGASPGGMPAGSAEVHNSFGDARYGGPEPDVGSKGHTYVFTVYALSEELTGVVTYDDFLVLIDGKVLAEAQWTGTFSR